MKNNKPVIIAVAVAVAVLIGVVAGVVSTQDEMPETSVPLSITEADAETEGEAQTEESTEETTKKRSIFSGKKDENAGETNASTTKPAPATQKIRGYEYAYAGFEPALAKVGGTDWNLLLVNRDYILPEDYEVELAPSITGDSSSPSLDYRVAPRYNEMYLAARSDGITLTPVSGYRSLTRQRNNFENKIDYYEGLGYSLAEATQLAAKRILPPGTSEHNAGMAMDICVASVDAHFENSAEYEWLAENAADYGFILRYPEDKQDITQITYEPWHWRYVGVDAARAMKASGQCLEEYLGYAS